MNKDVLIVYASHGIGEERRKIQGRTEETVITKRRNQAE